MSSLGPDGKSKKMVRSINKLTFFQISQKFTG